MNSEITKYYTGIGSRKTPKEIQNLITEIAIKLRNKGFCLRSGGAEGADMSFEKGAKKFKEIFYAQDATLEAINLAIKFHPIPDKLSDYAKKLHGRNSFQVLGKNLKTPSKFLICWTPDGCTNHKDRTIKTGGTGTAISIAWINKINIHNLANKHTIELVNKWLKI